jgi:hypothetical protein
MFCDPGTRIEDGDEDEDEDEDETGRGRRRIRRSPWSFS